MMAVGFGCFDAELVAGFLEREIDLFQVFLSDNEIDEAEAEVIIEDLRRAYGCGGRED